MEDTLESDHREHSVGRKKIKQSYIEDMKNHPNFIGHRVSRADNVKRESITYGCIYLWKSLS